MSNYIFDINSNNNSNNNTNSNSNFDFSIINLANPTLINNNNYFSKISHGSLNKNVYIQLPKCSTKQGIVKSNNKTYCELNFNIANKNVIEFFENLEKYCINEIYRNKELWFYEANDMTVEDIEELMYSIMKPYKHGKNLLIKTYINLNKFSIYDENEMKINIDNYNNNHEFLPLVNINGIKFSSKNFTIELILSQIMVIYPSDEFEKQLLIKFDSKLKNNKQTEDVKDNKEEIKTQDDKDEIKTQDNEEEIKTQDDKEEIKTQDNEEEIKTQDNKDEIKTQDDEEEIKTQDNKDEIKTQDTEDEIKTEEGKEIQGGTENINLLKNEKIENNLENNELKYLFNKDLETIDLSDIKETKKENENENVNYKLKSHEDIYLEMYKKAKRRANEIKENAIQAFLEAKSIKNKYSISNVEESDSEEEFINSM